MKKVMLLLLLTATAFGKKLHAQPMGGKTGASDWHTLPPIATPTPIPKVPPSATPPPIATPTPIPKLPPPGQYPTKHK